MNKLIYTYLIYVRDYKHVLCAWRWVWISGEQVSAAEKTPLEQLDWVHRHLLSENPIFVEP